MKPRSLEKIIRGLRIPILILITVLIFNGCESSENKRISKDNVPEIIDLSKEDAIVESRTYIGSGYINIVLIRGHEYAIISSRADEMESSALWGTHLTETCIGCRGGEIQIDTITLNHHKFKIQCTKYDDGKSSCIAEHLPPAEKKGCDYCWKQLD
jgi:hypothetical protein